MANKPLEQLEQFAIDVILDRRMGKRAAVLRFVAWILSYIYAGIMRLRWWLYEKRYLRWHSAGCLVISVGNLTVGGTGKTPVVEKFARVLSENGRRVAILSRGYKSVPSPFLSRWWRKSPFAKLPIRLVSSPMENLCCSIPIGRATNPSCSHRICAMSLCWSTKTG